MARSQFDREHVTRYLYSHPEKFNLRLIPAPAEIDREDVRLTVDLDEDWDHALAIYEALGPERLDWQRIARLLDHQPALRSRMAALNRVHQRPVRCRRGVVRTVPCAATPWTAHRACLLHCQPSQTPARGFQKRGQLGGNQHPQLVGPRGGQRVVPAVGPVFRRLAFGRLARMETDLHQPILPRAGQESPQQPQIDAAGVGRAEEHVGMGHAQRIHPRAEPSGKGPLHAGQRPFPEAAAEHGRSPQRRVPTPREPP